MPAPAQNDFADLGAVPVTKQPDYSDIGAIPVQKQDFSDLGAVSTDDYVKQKAQDATFDPHAYAAQAFGNPNVTPAQAKQTYDLAYKIQQERQANPLPLDIPGAVGNAAKGIVQLGKGVFQGITGGLNEAYDWATNDPNKMTDAATATLAGQNIEESLKGQGRGLVDWINRNDPTMSPQEREEAQQAAFNANVHAAYRQQQLAQGRPLDTGAVARLANAGSPGVTQAESPEALKAAEAAPVNLEQVQNIAAAGNPENLALAAIPEIPGIAKIGGGALKVAGKALSIPADALDAIGSHIPFLPRSPIARAVAGTGGVIEGLPYALAHPGAALGTGLATAAIYGGRGLGNFLTQVGKETAGEALAPADRGIFGSIGAKIARGGAQGISTAAGFAPINFAFSEGDPQKFLESEVGAGMFGATAGTAGELLRDPLASRFANADRARGGTPQLSTAPFDYNTTPDLDAASNAAQSRKTPEQQAEFNQVRHAMQGHVELYTLPEADFQKAQSDYAKATGSDPNATGDAFYDQANKRVIIREGARDPIQAAWHEVGHDVVNSLEPADRARAVAALTRSNDMDAFAKNYFTKLYGPKYQGLTWDMLPDTRAEATKQGISNNLSKEAMGDELLAEQTAQMMRGMPIDSLTKGNKTLKRRFQDIAGKVAEQMGYKVTTQEAQSILGVNPSFTAAHIIEQALQERAQGAGVAPAYGGDLNARNRIAQLDKILATPPTPDSTVEQVKAYQSAQRERSSLAKTTAPAPEPLTQAQQYAKDTLVGQGKSEAVADKAVRQFPAHATIQDILRAPNIDELTKAGEAWEPSKSTFPGAKQPEGLPGLRQTNTRAAAENAVLPAIVKLHGGTTADARAAVAAVQAEAGDTPLATPEAILKAVNERSNRLKGIGQPKEPTPITAPVDRIFRDPEGNEHRVTGESSTPPKAGDYVITGDGNIRRVAKVRDDGSLDVVFPATEDERTTMPVKAGNFKGLAHDVQQASPEGTLATKALKVVRGTGGSFDIVNEKGEVVKSGLADEAAANRSLAQLQKAKASTFTIPPNPAGAPDIIDHIMEQGGIAPKPKGAGQEYDDIPQNMRGVYQQLMGGKMTPDDMAQALAHGDPEQGISGIGDGSVSGMWKAIEDAINARKSLREQQYAEQQRIAKEKKQTPTVPTAGDNDTTSTTSAPGSQPLPEGPGQSTAVAAPPAPPPAPPAVPDQTDVGEFDRIAAEAKDAFLAAQAVAKSGPNKGQHTKANQQAAEREGFYSAARAHAEDLPENYRGISYHVDQFGRESVSGRIDPSRSFDQWLIKQATEAGHMSPAILKTMLDFQNNFGRTVSWDYDSANLAKYGQEPTGEERRLMQREQTASGRVAGNAEMQTTVKTGIPLTIGYNYGEKSFNVIGESQPKLLNNFNFLRDVFGKMGKTMPFRNINDPRLAEVIQGGIKNHQNDYKFDGSGPMTGTQAYEANPTPGYKPLPMTKDEANFVNVLFGNESLKAERGGKVTPEAEAKQEFANVNKAPWTATGESNPLRQEINDFIGPVQRMALEKNENGETKLVPKVDKEGNPLTSTWSKTWLEDPLNEAIRPELAQNITTPRQSEEAIRQHGYTGDMSNLLEGGRPNQAAVSANFMPATEAGAENRPEATKERARLLWAQKGTDSPFFKKWFGGSKVVDGQGNPMVVYHASKNGSFNSFDTSKEGSHFGTLEQAENVHQGGEPKSFFLSIKNPLRMPDIGVWNNFNNLHAALSREDVITTKESDAIWDAWMQSPNGWKKLKEVLQKKGFDGIVYKNEQEGDGDSYIAFDPTQIKSATGNRGTFDPKDANINFMPATPDEPQTPQEAARQRIAARAATEQKEQQHPIEVGNARMSAGPQAMFLPAYHGTPHTIEGRFSNDKIGTGEGAQAFGYGLYFAQEKQVADAYRTALARSQPSEEMVGNEPYQWDNPIHDAAFNIWRAGSRANYEQQLERTQDLKKWDVLRNNDIPKYTRIKGNLYTVDLKAEPEEMLDYDKPLDEQSDQVQKAMRQAFINHGMPLDKNGEPLALEKSSYGGYPDGQSMYAYLAATKGEKYASELLASLGIKGIQYADQGSRSRTEGGTKNFVIFNPDDIEITHKNGEPVTPQERAQFMPTGKFGDPRKPDDIAVERWQTGLGKDWQTPSLFFGPDGSGYRDYGPDRVPAAIHKDAKLYDGTSSYDYVKANVDLNEPRADVKRITGLNTLAQVYEHMGDYDKFNGEVDTNPDFAAWQEVAKKELNRKGYDGAHWSDEDALSPEQYQVWNKNVIRFMPNTGDLQTVKALEREQQTRALTPQELARLRIAKRQIAEDAEGPGDQGAEMVHRMTARTPQQKQ